MPEPIVHASFSVERTMPAPPARVFAAFADPELKAKWFHGPDGWEPTRTLAFDFREGGHETAAGEVPGEWSSRFEATYHVIEPDAQIVYSYEMFHDEVRLSVSVTSIELDADRRRRGDPPGVHRAGRVLRGRRGRATPAARKARSAC